MSRTEGSGWGGGVILYQICPHCNKKKVMYDPFRFLPSFKCVSCRERFDSETLIYNKYKKDERKGTEIRNLHI
jgi:transposase-like protein